MSESAPSVAALVDVTEEVEPEVRRYVIGERLCDEVLGAIGEMDEMLFADGAEVL